MLVRLTRKYAECLDGVDLSTHHVGQILELPERDAALLIAEGWARPTSQEFARAQTRAENGAPTDSSHEPAELPSQRRKRRVE
jgi:hypothetical protein